MSDFVRLRAPAQLENPIKTYAWGSRRALAELQGRPAPTPEPEAELWMGAHPAGPSRVLVASELRLLPEVIAADPDGTLGGPVRARFGRLPFLLKVLAAEQPLSIQAHPSESQARAGFDAEERAGVPRDAPRRNYKDPHHKPERADQLGPFEALSGFRTPADLARLASTLGIEAWQRAVDAALCGAAPLRELFVGSLRLPVERRAELVRAVVAGCRAAGSALPVPERAVARWVVELGERYPGDAGVLAPLILNYVELGPGGALYLGAGSPYAYLRGLGIEIMASSDNVLRGGLTPKHVDIDELERVLRFEPGPVRELRAEPGASGEALYASPASEFRLSRWELGARTVASNVAEPQILLCWQGSARLRWASGELVLERGMSAFVPASAPPYGLIGPAVVFRARPGALA